MTSRHAHTAHTKHAPSQAAKQEGASKGYITQLSVVANYYYKMKPEGPWVARPVGSSWGARAAAERAEGLDCNREGVMGNGGMSQRPAQAMAPPATRHSSFCRQNSTTAAH